jgi:hypothetical protein
MAAFRRLGGAVKSYLAPVSCPRCGGTLEHIEGAPLEKHRPVQQAATAVCACTECHASFRLLAFLWPVAEEREFALAPALTPDNRLRYHTPDSLGPLKKLAHRLAALTGEPVTTTEQRVYRWARFGLTATEADELACALGSHPVTIWPDWYEKVN